ncbi:winged helix-turn-helix domain-containing protein [Benzoatithermus flavus]|uniref:Response regulator transcription factor n=1 Tax=Benzoatithermus flavus TaxID=3108223 RepID=A0ABU8XT96_9PROT
MLQLAGTSSRILLVDDDRRLCRFLSRFLGREGYATAIAHDGRAMRRAIADSGFDLVILDLTFPEGEDGISLARGLRAQCGTPLLILSGKSSTIDKVVCLELGADDYVTKPFEPRELLARIRSLLRRAGYGPEPLRSTGHPPEGGEVVRFLGWRLDRARRALLSPEGRPVRLTSREFDLLEALAVRPGRILSREQILDIVANRHWTPFDRSIDVLIGKIRKKLQDHARDAQLIKTVRGIGYMFVPAPPDG